MCLRRGYAFEEGFDLKKTGRMMRAFDQGASHTVLLCHPSCVLGVA